jgi:hypothetical protein
MQFVTNPIGEMMETITISTDLAYSIWNYIASKPFAEVGNLATAYQAVVGPQIAAIENAAKEAAEKAAEVTTVTPTP